MDSGMPTPRKTTLKDMLMWFFSCFGVLIQFCLMVVICVFAACVIWAVDFKKQTGAFPTWGYFSSVVERAFGVKP